MSRQQIPAAPPGDMPRPAAAADAAQASRAAVLDAQARELAEHDRPLWIGIAASQVGAAQTRGLAGKDQRTDAHSISPAAHHQMWLVDPQ